MARPVRKLSTIVIETFRWHGAIPWSSSERLTYAEVPVVTSKKDASKASKQLTSPKSTSAEKSVAGSDLAQAKGKGQGGTSGKATKKEK
jgi:hypothetical protein